MLADESALTFAAFSMSLFMSADVCVARHKNVYLHGKSCNNYRWFIRPTRWSTKFLWG